MKKTGQRLAALTAAFVLAMPAGATDLSPSRWPEAELKALEAREAVVMPTATRTVESSNGLVAGTASPIAVRAGIEALRQGGTAADAAAATALAQVGDWLGANVSYAGVAQLLYYDARTKRVFAMDAGWNSWRRETHPDSLPEPDLSAVIGGESRSSGAAGRKTLVPGFMAGIEAMHRRFGRLSFASLFGPAIWQAEHGVKLTPLHQLWFGMAGKYLGQTEEGRRFAMANGAQPPKAGTLFVQPKLAALLRRIARDGAGEMYRGAWARHFVDAVDRAGGHASLADLAAYRVRWSEPLSTLFAGATLRAPVGSSGCAILEALNLAGNAPLRGTYWQDPDSFRTLSLAIRVGQFAAAAPEAAAPIEARETGLGGSCPARLTPAFGAAAAGKLEAMLQGGSVRAGHHSASVVVVDRWGNVAALVHSSNTPLWGETGLVVDGVPIPSPAPIYRYALIHVAPGERVPTDMAPLIALRGGKPVLAVATIGVSLAGETVRLVDSLFRGGADPASAMSAPPLLLDIDSARDPSSPPEDIVPAGRYPADWLAQAGATGIKLREVESRRAEALRGTAVIAAIGFNGKASSVEVPGVLGFAQGN